MAELAPETMVDGRYRVVSRIGSGGMGDVFRARDTSLGRDVALKLLHRRFAEDAEFVERFRREASSAAALQHPCVVSVYDRGEWDGTYYIAMEYLPGRTLKQVLRDDGPLDPLRAIDITVQILKAARFAHRRGVIHRDLKPHNVIVDDEDRVKVTDFGIARAGASDMTETGSILGTAQYLSPEQAQGHAVSAASDLYSVGVILYELLTGQVPFQAEAAVTVALKHVSEEPVAPSLLNPAVPPVLDRIVMWALSKNPAGRPADAAEFIAALESARAQLTGGGPSTTEFAAAPAPVPDTEATQVWEGSATADAPAIGYAPDYPPVPRRAVPPPPRRRRRWWLAPLLLLVIGGAAAAYAILRPARHSVPSVIGRTFQDAAATLKGDGFEVAEPARTRSARPIDQVLRQTPGPGGRLAEGTTITLTVSAGPGQAPVPDVAGSTRSQALALLRRFRAVVRHEKSSSVNAGLAIGTRPGAGTRRDVGSRVVLLVSDGPSTAPVPDLRGDKLAQAQAALYAAGFQPQVVQQESDKPPGTVLSQGFAPGTPLDKGSTVSIVVAKKPRRVGVPSVIGQPATDASNALFDAGFHPVEVTTQVTDPNQDGVVLAQRPLPGEQRTRGAQVKLYVGKYPTAPTPGQPPTGPPAGQ